MGATLVGPQARREYLERMRERYVLATRAATGRLLDEVCEGRLGRAIMRAQRARHGASGPHEAPA